MFSGPWSAPDILFYQQLRELVPNELKWIPLSNQNYSSDMPIGDRQGYIDIPPAEATMFLLRWSFVDARRYRNRNSV